MGTVYEVEDRFTGEHLALKTLSQLGATELFLVKNEFRGLTDVVHPNLVGPRELLARDPASRSS